MAVKRLPNLADETERNTTVRKVSKVAKPKRQSLTHHKNPNVAPKTTPRMRKRNQKTQLKRERTTVRLSTKIGSLRMILLRKKSIMKLTAKSAAPRRSPLVKPWIEGKNMVVETPVIRHIAAIAARAFLKDGKKNRDA
jgi:hypothetical protein